VSIIANVATYTISPSELPTTLSLDDGYLQYWELTIGGVVHTFKKPTAIALSALYPVISDLDLEAEYSDHHWAPVIKRTLMRRGSNSSNG
jgi:hypothetical protein